MVESLGGAAGLIKPMDACQDFFGRYLLGHVGQLSLTCSGERNAVAADGRLSRCKGVRVSAPTPVTAIAAAP